MQADTQMQVIEPPLGEFEHIEQRLADLVPSLAALSDLCGTRLASREHALAVINDAMHGLDIARASLAETHDFCESIEAPMVFGTSPDSYLHMDRQDRRNWALSMSRDLPDLISTRGDFAAAVVFAKSIWRGLAEDWPYWDFIDHNGWKPIFKRARPAWTLEVFSEEQRAVYDALPESMTVYRGVNTVKRHNHRGLSWTLDEEKAYWFAKRAALFGGGSDGVVYRGTLAKKGVALVFPGQESEVVPFSAMDICDIEVMASGLSWSR